MAISVDGWSGNIPNQAYVTVTVCPPGSANNCQAVDHVLLDTGSFGLRLMASVLSPALASALPPQTDTASGNSLSECTQFVSGYIWGPIKLADVVMGGEAAVTMPLQVVDDRPSPIPPAPPSCSSSGVAMNSVAQFGANGVLGVGAFRYDLGLYYACNGAMCTPVAVPLAKQVQNPVALLKADNNGVLIDLPALPTGGAASASGSLILGIGTQSNNGLGTAQVYTFDAFGDFTTTYKSGALTSFVDSGSNGYFFDDATITPCSNSIGFYCPASPLALSAIISGFNGASATINFTLMNIDATNDQAMSMIGGPYDGSFSSFDWGLPFFYGRKVFTHIEGMVSPGGAAPYVAF